MSCALQTCVMISRLVITAWLITCAASDESSSDKGGFCAAFPYLCPHTHFKPTLVRTDAPTPVPTPVRPTPVPTPPPLVRTRHWWDHPGAVHVCPITRLEAAGLPSTVTGAGARHKADALKLTGALAALEQLRLGTVRLQLAAGTGEIRHDVRVRDGEDAARFVFPRYTERRGGKYPPVQLRWNRSLRAWELLLRRGGDGRRDNDNDSARRHDDAVLLRARVVVPAPQLVPKGGWRHVTESGDRSAPLDGLRMVCVEAMPTPAPTPVPTPIPETRPPTLAPTYMPTPAPTPYAIAPNDCANVQLSIETAQLPADPARAAHMRAEPWWHCIGQFRWLRGVATSSYGHGGTGPVYARETTTDGHQRAREIEHGSSTCFIAFDGAAWVIIASKSGYRGRMHRHASGSRIDADLAAQRADWAASLAGSPFWRLRPRQTFSKGLLDLAAALGSGAMDAKPGTAAVTSDGGALLSWVRSNAYVQPPQVRARCIARNYRQAAAHAEALRRQRQRQRQEQKRRDELASWLAKDSASLPTWAVLAQRKMLGERLAAAEAAKAPRDRLTRRVQFRIIVGVACCIVALAAIALTQRRKHQHLMGMDADGVALGEQQRLFALDDADLDRDRSTHTGTTRDMESFLVNIAARHMPDARHGGGSGTRTARREKHRDQQQSISLSLQSWGGSHHRTSGAFVVSGT